MLRPHHFILLVSLLADGGTVAPPSGSSRPDAGTDAGVVSPSARDTGTRAAVVNPSARDAGAVARELPMVDGRVPDDLQTLAELDARAVMAAHAAIQEFITSNVKANPRNAGSCDYSPKAMDVSIMESSGMYVVIIGRRLDRCGGADISFNAGFAPQVYVVSPEGRVLAHPHYDYYQ